jgi:DMSO/TMAO reductase YedYZ molybdopterin-dependent catalytic subunit
MSTSLSRRKLITAGLATAAGATGVAVAARLAERLGLVPPDHSGIYGIGKTLTYASQRLVTARHSMVREFTRAEISAVAPINGDPPETETYRQHLAENFVNWRLAVDGMVARPSTFSLDDLKRLPAQSQITHQACEAGWAFIAEWTGVPLSYLLNLVGASQRAKYAVFFPFDMKWGSLDPLDAWHPQTLLAYAMNGQDLPTPHGAPLRVRVPRQLGFKSTKYLARITVTDTVKNIGKGLGSASPERGFAWYGGM